MTPKLKNSADKIREYSFYDDGKNSISFYIQRTLMNIWLFYIEFNDIHKRVKDFSNEKDIHWSNSKFLKEFTANKNIYYRAIIKLVLDSDTRDLFIGSYQ